jgi:hypothetical protein
LRRSIRADAVIPYNMEGRGMRGEMEKTVKVGTKIGALAGGILFLIFGLVPVFYIGSFGTVALLAYLTGGPVEAGLLMRALIVVGTVVALLCAAGVSIIAGSVAGTVLAYVAEAITAAFRRKEAAAGTGPSSSTE